MEVNKSIFKRQADFLEKNGKYILQFTSENRNLIKNVHNLTNGPGKLCSALKINREFSGYDLVTGENLYLEKNESKEKIEVVCSKRVGIDYAEEYAEKLWRFYIKNNKFVSKK